MRALVARSPQPHEGVCEVTVASGQLHTRVARTLALANAAEAHRLVEQGGLRGKIVLRNG